MSTKPKVALFLFLSAIALGASAQKTVDFRGTGEKKVEYDNLSYLPSGDSIVSLDLAMRAFNNGRFQINNQRYINLGIAKDNYWVRFSLQNHSEANPLYVNLGNPRLNDVSLFVLVGDSLASSYTLGDNFNFYTRLLYQNQFTFPVQFKGAEQLDIFLYISHKGNTLQMPVTVMDQNALLEYIEVNYLFLGIASGIFIITFFFGVFFLFNTKDPLFIYYSGYIISAGAWVWTTEGFAFQYLWPAIPEFATRLGPGVSAMSAAFFIASCMQFCKPYDRNSLARKIILGILAFVTLWSVAPFMPFIPLTSGTMSVYLSVYFTANVSMAFILSVYLINLSRKHPITLYYFFAVLVTIISSVTVVLRGTGWLDIPFSTSTVMSSGYIIELILMTAGITRQFYSYRKEKEETLLAYLEQEKGTTQKILATQEFERQRIGRELHDDVGGRLTQITLMSEAALQYSSSGIDNAKELRDIASTSRNLVKSMGEIIWSMDPEHKTLAELFVYLREQLNQLLEYADIEYTITFPVNPDGVQLSNVQLRNIVLISKEVVNNAVRHSRCTKLSVGFSREDHLLRFCVTDNGAGMDLTKVKSGNGLRNIRRRALEMNGTLTIESTEGGGSVVEYTIPC